MIHFSQTSQKVHLTTSQHADIFKDIFKWFSDLTHILLKFAPSRPNDNLPLVQAIACCRTGDKPLPEQMMIMTYWRIHS